MTTTNDKLPEFEGQQPAYATVKINGNATGFSEGLKLDPVAFHLGQVVDFVVRAEVRGIDHPLDKDDVMFRRADLRITDMAFVDKEVSDRALQQQAKRVEDLKAAIDGQLRLDEEAEAEAREELDETGTPEEIAEASRARFQKP